MSGSKEEGLLFAYAVVIAALAAWLCICHLGHLLLRGTIAPVVEVRVEVDLSNP